MPASSPRSRTLGAAVLLLALAGPVAAQDDLARVKLQMPFAASMGVAGDAVEGLGLGLTNLETGETMSVLTGADGAFVFPDLEPGPYRLHLSPPARGALDEEISIALPRAFLAGPRDAGEGALEIVVVGMAEPLPEGARGIPAHTPEWTDLSDHDPGAPATEGHRRWIELSSLSVTVDDETLVLTVPPEAWGLAGSGSYFDLFIGADRSAVREPRMVPRPRPACYACDIRQANVVQGGVVFGDGIRGSRPPPRKAAAPPRAEPVEKPEVAVPVPRAEPPEKP